MPNHDGPVCSQCGKPNHEYGRGRLCPRCLVRAIDAALADGLRGQASSRKSGLPELCAYEERQ